MNCFEASLSLLEEGYQCVPLDKNKTPIISFKDVPITKKFINKNRKEYERTRVLGMLCRGVWCIDIDRGHKENEDGMNSLMKLEDIWSEIVTNAKNTLVQKTPSGGRHIVFKKREGINYTQHIGYLNGVDIKAHDNNYFVLAGSVTQRGMYTHNNKDINFYEGSYIEYFNGTFEDRIFSTRGSYEQQTLDKYSIKKVLHDYDFTHVSSLSGRGEGARAYERIIDGTSVSRNNDLFLAASYCKTCNVDVEPLKVLIGDVANGDVFTEREFFNTFESARAF